MFRRLLLISLLATVTLLPLMAKSGSGVPKKSVVLDGLDVDSMRTRLDETDMQPLQGSRTQ